METKPAIQSKTLWINLFMAVTALFYPPANNFVASHGDLVVVAVGVINGILRVITKDKIELW